MAVTEKIDFHKTHRAEYVAPKQPVFVEIQPARYLAIEGYGKPGSPLFQAQTGALYGAAYAIKMGLKSAGRGDFKVPALEGLYQDVDNQSGEMKWKLLIRVPEFVTERDLADAVAALEKKGKDGEAKNIRIETIEEGRCVQMLHVGPYSEEPATIQRMQAYAEENGCALAGAHHEIYLSDPNRVPPERLRTILRLPVVEKLLGKKS